MHVIATNVCVWLRLVVLETLTAGVATRLIQFPTGDIFSDTSTVVNVTPVMYHYMTAIDGDNDSQRVHVDRIGFHNEQKNNASGTHTVPMLPLCMVPFV